MTAAVKVNWKGPAYIKRFGVRVDGNAERAALFLVRAIVKSFPPSGASAPAKGKKDKRTRSGGGNRKNPSKPEGIPHVQTGQLKNSIRASKVNAGHWRVGSTLKPAKGQQGSYAMYLELGTPHGQMAPRPYLRPALNTNRTKLRKMIAQ